MLPPVPKPKTIKCLGPVEVAPLLARVRQLSDKAWTAENSGKENDFEVFHKTQHMIFRFIRGNVDALDYYEQPAWPIWASLIQPVMDQAVQAYGYVKPVFPKIMLAKLAAGHDIPSHTDGAGSNLQVHKVHVPLISNPDAVMCVGSDQQHLKVGWAYEVNNIAPHGVRNEGSEDRVHLIFEVHEGG